MRPMTAAWWRLTLVTGLLAGLAAFAIGWAEFYALGWFVPYEVILVLAIVSGFAIGRYASLRVNRASSRSGVPVAFPYDPKAHAPDAEFADVIDWRPESRAWLCKACWSEQAGGDSDSLFNSAISHYRFHKQVG